MIIKRSKRQCVSDKKEVIHFIVGIITRKDGTRMMAWYQNQTQNFKAKDRTHTKMDCRQWLLNQWRHHYMWLCWVWKNTTENGGIIVVWREKSMATSGANKIRLQSDFSHWKMQQTRQFLLWKELENSNTTNSDLGRDREPSLQSYEQERTRRHQAPPITDAENDFSPRKINQNQSFFLQNTQWDDDTAMIHTCLGGEGFPGTMRDAKALMVGGGRGHVAGYTSGLY